MEENNFNNFLEDQKQKDLSDQNDTPENNSSAFIKDLGKKIKGYRKMVEHKKREENKLIKHHKLNNERLLSEDIDHTEINYNNSDNVD